MIEFQNINEKGVTLVKRSLNDYSMIVNVLLKWSVSSPLSDCHLFTIRSTSFGYPKNLY